MQILFDQGTPVPLRHSMSGHEIKTAFEMGWATLNNGELLAKAEDSFQLFITTDRNLQYQQNLADRKLAILVLPTTSWPVIRQHTKLIAEAIDRLQPNDYTELTW